MWQARRENIKKALSPFVLIVLVPMFLFGVYNWLATGPAVFAKRPQRHPNHRSVLPESECDLIIARFLLNEPDVAVRFRQGLQRFTIERLGSIQVIANPDIGFCYILACGWCIDRINRADKVIVITNTHANTLGAEIVPG